LPVELRVEGKPVSLPPGIDLTAYRVVQEALTNALKHARDARATVTVRYEPWEVVLEVEDDGVGRDRHGELRDTGGGHGLVGMRERVALYHGLLQAGPRHGGGFAVRVRLPTVTARPGGPSATTPAPTDGAPAASITLADGADAASAPPTDGAPAASTPPTNGASA
jgi:signal transduction histidine kinase